MSVAHPDRTKFTWEKLFLMIHGSGTRLSTLIDALEVVEMPIRGNL